MGYGIFLSVRRDSIWSIGFYDYGKWMLILASVMLATGAIGLGGIANKSSIATRFYSFLAVITLTLQVALGVYIAIETRHVHCILLLIPTVFVLLLCCR
jgi:hypothetical protein